VKTKYKAIFWFGPPTVVIKQVVSETAMFVTYAPNPDQDRWRGTQNTKEKKETASHTYYDSFEEAKECIVRVCKSRLSKAKQEVAKQEGYLARSYDLTLCYQCEKPVFYLFDDSRCKDCTRLTPEEMTGGDL